MTDRLKSALVIVFDGIEEVEALTPVDILRRAAIDVTVASVEPQATVTGRNQITFAADTDLSQVDASSFDLVLLPGGPGVLELLENSAVRDALLAQNHAAKALAALCAAPKVLAVHGILAGKKATSHASVRDTLPIPSDDPVVVDGHITTSQGAGTAVAFSLTLVKNLCGESTAQKIADSIHFSN